MPGISKSAATILAGLILLLGPGLLFGQKLPIAVLDFDAFGISEVEAAALSNRLRNELFRLGRFNVVDRGMMENILKEQDFQQTGCTSNDCLVEVGRILGAQQMVGGSVSKVGQTFTVSARLVDVASGQLLAVSDFDLRGELDDLLTRGMGQVAAMLSFEDTDIEQPDVAESPAIIDPQPVAELPVAESTGTFGSNTDQEFKSRGFDLSLSKGKVKKNSNGNIKSVSGSSLLLGIGYKKYFGDGAKPDKLNWYWSIGTDLIIAPFIGVGADYLYGKDGDRYIGLLLSSRALIDNGDPFYFLSIGRYL
ncbi:DUF2380 domain-containing protein [Candidatus Neomarinimicrobiota bacterium]